MLAVLLILLALPDPAPESAVQALLDACNEAASPATCALANPGTRTHVEIHWESASSVSIHFDLPDGPRSKVRSLTFARADPLLERYRAIGYAIGTWTQVEDEPPPSPQPDPPTSEPALPLQRTDTLRATPVKPITTQWSPPRPSSSSPPTWLSDAFVITRSGLDGSFAPGVGLSFGTLNQWGWLDVSLRGDFSVDLGVTTPASRLDATFWAASLRFGSSFERGPLRAGFDVGPFIEAVTVGGPEVRQQATNWIGGGAASLWLRYRIAGPFFLLGGVDAGIRTERTTVYLNEVIATGLKPELFGGRLGFGLYL